MLFFEIIKAIVIGIVEGVTEWLPISSTGHMILVNEFITMNVSPEFMEMFLFVIQLGAILAVPICFWRRINPFYKTKNEAERKNTYKMWTKIIVGVIPAALIGVLLDDFFEEHFYNWFVVALALILYGIAFIIIENNKKNKGCKIVSIDDLSYSDAVKIGAFQVLAIIPGTSRSGSTILGGMMCGVSREVAAEFSFYMAMPVMLGSSALKVVKFILKGISVTLPEILILLVGTAVAFLVSLFAIKFLMDFVKRHDFKPFGVYRIILGAVVIVYFLISK